MARESRAKPTPCFSYVYFSWRHCYSCPAVPLRNWRCHKDNVCDFAKPTTWCTSRKFWSLFEDCVHFAEHDYCVDLDNKQCIDFVDMDICLLVYFDWAFSCTILRDLCKVILHMSGVSCGRGKMCKMCQILEPHKDGENFTSSPTRARANSKYVWFSTWERHKFWHLRCGSRHLETQFLGFWNSILKSILSRTSSSFWVFSFVALPSL